MSAEALVGRVYGRLTVIKRAGTDKSGHAIWHCTCSCGKGRKVSASNLKSGHTRSCGCYAKEVITKHAMHNTPTYHSWRSMIQRCTNPNSKDYLNYGGRGITVCPEWLGSFERFLADMGKRPNKRKTLDRIDVNKGYCKDNCRWATAKTQAQNKRMFYQEYEPGPF